jgi:hypothetical protein
LYPQQEGKLKSTLVLCGTPGYCEQGLAAKPSFQINHQPNATVFQFIILTFIYSSTCFGRFPTPHQELNDCSGSLWFYLRIVVTGVLCHHDTKVKPEAATAVTELLMMGGTTPETC